MEEHFSRPLERTEEVVLRHEGGGIRGVLGLYTLGGECDVDDRNVMVVRGGAPSRALAGLRKLAGSSYLSGGGVW